MIKPHRKAHALVWAILLPALAALVIWAALDRPTGPTPTTPTPAAPTQSP